MKSRTAAKELEKTQKTKAITIQNHQHHVPENVLSKYIKNIGTMNKTTAYEYQIRLTTFAKSVFNDYNITLDKLIIKLKEGFKILMIF